MMKVTTDGLPGLRRRVERLQAFCRNLDPQLTVEAVRWRTTVDDAFTRSTSPDGMGWAALAPATLEQHQREGYGTSPLIARGDGRNAIVLRVDKNDIVFGVAPTADYMKYHQFGGGRGGGMRVAKYPPRPFLPFGGTQDAPVMMGGKAKKLFDDMIGRIKNYILTGKVT